MKFSFKNLSTHRPGNTIGRSVMAYLISLIPAMFMTAVSVSYIVVAPEGLHLVNANPYIVGGVAALILFSIFVYSQIKYNAKRK